MSTVLRVKKPRGQSLLDKTSVQRQRESALLRLLGLNRRWQLVVIANENEAITPALNNRNLTGADAVDVNAGVFYGG